MTWFKLTDEFHSNRTMRDNAAAGLFAKAGSYSSQHLMDGFVDDEWLEEHTRGRGGRSGLDRLIAGGSIERGPGGVLIVNFLKHNPSREQVLERRRQEREKKRRMTAAARAKRRQLGLSEEVEKVFDQAHTHLNGDQTVTDREPDGDELVETRERRFARAGNAEACAQVHGSADPGGSSLGEVGARAHSSRRDSPSSRPDPTRSKDTPAYAAPLRKGGGSEPEEIDNAEAAAELGDLEATWELVLAELRGEVTDTTFHIWLEPLELTERGVGVLHVLAPDHITTWVRERFAPLLNTCATRALGEVTRVEVRGPQPVIDTARRRRRRGAKKGASA